LVHLNLGVLKSGASPHQISAGKEAVDLDLCLTFGLLALDFLYKLVETEVAPVLRHAAIMGKNLHFVIEELFDI
jgi:hypothetical protein